MLGRESKGKRDRGGFPDYWPSGKGGARVKSSLGMKKAVQGQNNGGNAGEETHFGTFVPIQD